MWRSYVQFNQINVCSHTHTHNTDKHLYRHTLFPFDWLHRWWHWVMLEAKRSSNQLHTHTQTHPRTTGMTFCLIKSGFWSSIYNKRHTHTHKGECDKHVVHVWSIWGHTPLSALLFVSFFPSHRPKGADVLFFHLMTRLLLVELNFHFKWGRSLPSMCVRLCAFVHGCSHMNMRCIYSVFNLSSICGSGLTLHKKKCLHYRCPQCVV